MGKYSVPEEIRKQKPKGTMVKLINGGYYVYEYSKVDGKTKSGRVIGRITAEDGFIANDSLLKNSPITNLEYGQYAVAIANSAKTKELLESHFGKEDGKRIYVVAMIHAVEDFTYMKGMKCIYDVSWLSKAFPSLAMGSESIGKLYDDLGRRQERVLSFEQELADNGSGKLAIDGHVMGSGSVRNDLAQKGYRFSVLKEDQMNLITAYDVEQLVPVAVRVCPGALTDSISVRDLLMDIELKDKLLIIDRGFYSKGNLTLFSQNGNRYIIPVPRNREECVTAVSDLNMDELFVYEANRDFRAVEWKMDEYDGYRVYTFRDKDEAAKEIANYQRMMDLGKEGYTQEGLMKAKDFLGVYVLRTSDLTLSAKEVFMWYKKRWRIETYYKHLKIEDDFTAPSQQQYCRMQGLAFVMLVSSLIQRELAEAVSKLKTRLSVGDVLAKARMVKALKRGKTWVCTNTTKEASTILESLGVPLRLNKVT